MTVVLHYGLFFLFCYVRTLRETDFLSKLCYTFLDSRSVRKFSVYFA